MNSRSPKTSYHATKLWRNQTTDSRSLSTKVRCRLKNWRKPSFHTRRNTQWRWFKKVVRLPVSRRVSRSLTLKRSSSFHRTRSPRVPRWRPLVNMVKFWWRSTICTWRWASAKTGSLSRWPERETMTTLCPHSQESTSMPTRRTKAKLSRLLWHSWPRLSSLLIHMLNCRSSTRRTWLREPP